MIGDKKKIVLDIGSSTGGFTEVSLKNGAKKVIAVDVGTNLMHKSLRERKEVELHEQTNFNDIPIDFVKDAEIAVVDVSFISVKNIINKFLKLNNLKQILCLVKPQFEVGKENAKKHKGVIRDKELHKDVIKSLIIEFNKINFKERNITFSPITGKGGNIEYILHLTNETNSKEINIDNVVQEAFEKLAS